MSSTSPTEPAYLPFRRIARPVIQVGAGLLRRTFAASSDQLRGDTLSLVPADQLRVSSNNALHTEGYQASPGRLFWCSVGSLPISFEDYVFTDLGSGRGRVIKMAMKLPFSRIEGVEFSEELHESAVLQVAGLPAHEAGRVRLHHIDVVDYDLPDSNLVIYIFNSFRRPILEKVADKVIHSHRAHPRNIYLVYCNPRFREAFDERQLPVLASGWTGRVLDRLSGYPVVIYHLAP